MKLSKILMTVAAAAALVGFAGCSSDAAGNDIIEVSGKNASIDAVNSSVQEEGKNNYLRGFKTVKGTDWESCAYTLTIHNADKTSGVMGLAFSEKDNLAGNGYDMFILGLRSDGATSPKAQIYLSYFVGVTDEELSDGNANSFGTEYTLIDATSDGIATSGSYYTINSSIDSNKDITVTVVVTQDKTTHTYSIAIYDGAKTKAELDDVSGLTNLLANAVITSGSNSFKANCKDYSAKSVYKAGNDADVECTSDTLSSFHTMCGERDYEGKVGFYANVYSKQSESSDDINLSGEWDCIERTLEEEVVE